MKFLNFNISKRNIILIIILSVAIFTFSSLGTVNEGYKNKHKKRCNKQHKEEEECNSDGDGNGDDDGDDDVNGNGDENGDGNDISGSYTAPAGNTVLFGIDMEDIMSNNKQRRKHKKDPMGIPGSDIPDGDEDLYILKSEVVPPVCPACPNVTVCPKNNNNKPPPPCPPCGRCPESSFECKKVPNYNRSDNDSNMNYNHKNRDYGNRDYGNKGFSNINFSNTNSSYGDFLPRPVLTDFSQFGM